MFLLIGMRPVLTVLFAVTFVCGHCGTAAQQRIVRAQRKVTLLFIPLLTVGTSWFVECDHCARQTELTRDQAEHGVQWAATHERAAA